MVEFKYLCRKGDSNYRFIHNNARVAFRQKEGTRGREKGKAEETEKIEGGAGQRRCTDW